VTTAEKSYASQPEEFTLDVRLVKVRFDDLRQIDEFNKQPFDEKKHVRILNDIEAFWLSEASRPNENIVALNTSTYENGQQVRFKWHPNSAVLVKPKVAENGKTIYLSVKAAINGVTIAKPIRSKLNTGQSVLVYIGEWNHTSSIFLMVSPQLLKPLSNDQQSVDKNDIEQLFANTNDDRPDDEPLEQLFG
jgi:hypothetical protein